ncbi:hypothetical protein ACIBEJ_13870 [Nonomuraea sp. NPDC050790]|uniref:hypothetical protein n=1 Tax=Nonomuraea sp. NPDC050790 TaxID=3364371 RepID=UPI003794FD29
MRYAIDSRLPLVLTAAAVATGSLLLTAAPHAQAAATTHPASAAQLHQTTQTAQAAQADHAVQTVAGKGSKVRVFVTPKRATAGDHVMVGLKCPAGTTKGMVDGPTTFGSVDLGRLAGGKGTTMVELPAGVAAGKHPVYGYCGDSMNATGAAFFTVKN